MVLDRDRITVCSIKRWLRDGTGMNYVAGCGSD
jgi:hypothetical protein